MLPDTNGRELQWVSPAQSVAPDWLSNVWNIKTSEKIKVFIWKSLHKAIPVGEQFAIRNIPVSTLCLRCNEEESIMHLLFHCPFAVQVLDLAPSVGIINPLSFSSSREGWERTRKINSLPPNGNRSRNLCSMDLLVVLALEESTGFQKRSFTPAENLQKALTDAREWMMAQTPPISKSPKPSIRPKPNPRRSGQYSVFTDAAWNCSTKEAGFRWIIEDGISTSQHAVTSTFVSSSLLAETLAVLTAMNFVLSQSINSVAVLSYSQVFINTIKKKIMKLEIFGVLHDIYLLSVSFKSNLF